jgi:hypothetical protein
VVDWRDGGAGSGAPTERQAVGPGVYGG